MKIEANLTKDDLKKLRRYIFFKYRKTYLFYLACIIVVVIVSWPQPDSVTIIEKVSDVLVGLITFAVLYGVLMVVVLTIRKFTRSGSSSVLGKYTFELGDELFIEENAVGITQAKYSSFKHLGLTKEHIFLFMTSGSVFVIPKRAFNKSVKESEFVERLTQKIKAGQPQTS